MRMQEDTIDGIYSLSFRGAASFGVGVIALRDGVAAGADVAGVIYDGTYNETAQDITLDMELTVPPGVSLVQGTAPRSTLYHVPFHATIPKSAIKTNETILVQLPPGPVNVIIRRIRSLTH